MLASFLCGEFLLHILSWLLLLLFFSSHFFHFYLGSFPYTSPAGFIFMWGVSLKHPVLASFLCGEPLLHIPCWLPFLSGGFLLHIPCWLYFSLGSISYTSGAGFIFMRGVSLTHPVWALFLSWEFLLHIPACFLWRGGWGGGGLTHPMLLLFSCFFSFFFFLLFFPFCCGEFLLEILLGWLYLNLGSFSYTSRAGFPFLWGVSLTHPMLSSFLSGEFLLHIPCWLSFSVGSFSHTSHAGFPFLWGDSLTHPMLTLFLSGKFLLHIPCCLQFSLGSLS